MQTSDFLRNKTSELAADLSRRGVTIPAANWVVRALHPPSDNLGPVHIPDATYRPVVPIVFRPSVVISAPPGLGAAATWDLCLVNFPGDVVGCHYVAAPSPANFASTIYAAGSTVGALHLTDSPFRRRVRTLDAAGTVRDYGYPQPLSDHFGYRTTFSSMTAYMTASALNDGGTVTCAQLNVDPVVAGGVADAVAGPDGFYTAGLTTVFNIPLYEEDIVAQVPGARVAPAKEGVYMPLRLLGPTQRFVVEGPNGGTCYMPADTAAVTPLVFGRNSLSPTLTTYPTVEQPHGVGGTGAGWLRHLCLDAGVGLEPLFSFGTDTGYGNVATGVTIFRGLSQAATITVRMYVGQELLPRLTSPLKSMVAVPPPMDELALKLYYDLASRMPIAYPSRDNGFGLLLPKIISALKFIAPIVLPHVVSAVKDVVGAVTAKPAPPPKKKQAKAPGKKSAKAVG